MPGRVALSLGLPCQVLPALTSPLRSQWCLCTGQLSRDSVVKLDTVVWACVPSVASDLTFRLWFAAGPRDPWGQPPLTLGCSLRRPCDRGPRKLGRDSWPKKPWASKRAL